MSFTIHQGDALTVLQTLPSASVHCCVTSPPYWGLRDYGTAKWEGGSAHCDHTITRRNHVDSKQATSAGTSRDSLAGLSECRKCGAQRIDAQLGLERTPEEYVARLVGILGEVKRVLRDDGTLWLNLGDSYTGSGKGCNPEEGKQATNRGSQTVGTLYGKVGETAREAAVTNVSRRLCAAAGLKNKDLVGIPWSVAKALQAPHYTGKITSERDRIWLAATIDAEGSICGFHHTRKDDGTVRTGIHITITNTSTLMLDNAFRIWPTTRIDHNRHGEGHLGSLDTHRWIAHDVDEKAALLAELYPYLLVKKQQALLAWNFLEMSRISKRLGKTQEGADLKAKRSQIVHLLTRLNHFESVDIPTWCSEPPALYEPGWYLRSDIIWHKPAPMPESVTDRPTRSHEYIFLLAKSEKYYCDMEAIMEPAVCGWNGSSFDDPRDLLLYPNIGRKPRPSAQKGAFNGKTEAMADTGQNAFRAVTEPRNKRDVWTVNTKPFLEAHFATFPEELILPCILAGCAEFVCSACGNPVVQSNDAIIAESNTSQEELQRVREVLRRSQPEVLQQAMFNERSGAQQEAEAAPVQGLRTDVQSGREGEYLFTEVQRSMDNGTGITPKASVDREASSELEGGQSSRRGIHQNLRSDSEKVPAGTQNSDGKNDRSAINEIGICSSQERDQDGQPRREPRIDGGQSSQGHSHVPALRENILHSLSPCCKAPITGGTVLDPFAGAGTTLLVCEKWGRHSIGIELNPAYAEMARQRLDGFAPLFLREPESTEAERLALIVQPVAVAEREGEG